MKNLRFDDDRIGVLRHDAVFDVGHVISRREYRGPQRAIEELVGHFDVYEWLIAEVQARYQVCPICANMP